MFWCPDNSETRLWYQVQGVGRPLVLIHGWCMSSDIWNLLLPELAETFRVITVDLPGHGRSEPSHNGFSIQESAEAIAGLFDHLDLQCAVLAGWSLGGMVAVSSISLVRKRLCGLVLIAATPRFTKTEGYPHGLSIVEAEGMALKVRRSIARAREGFAANMFAPDELLDVSRSSEILKLLASIALPDTDTALQALQELVEADYRELLPLIDLPTLIIHGDRDVICPPGVSDFIAGLIAGADTVLFSGCGHAPFLSQPQQFTDGLRNFSRMYC
jgi:pimeloyl-[acyl-carrier protein] methyl ester esterase